MQQPKTEPNTKPIRKLKTIRIIWSGGLYKRPQRDFTEGRKEVLQKATEITKVEYRKSKLQIIPCRDNSRINLCIAVGNNLVGSRHRRPVSQRDNVWR